MLKRKEIFQVVKNPKRGQTPHPRLSIKFGRDWLRGARDRAGKRINNALGLTLKSPGLGRTQSSIQSFNSIPVPAVGTSGRKEPLPFTGAAIFNPCPARLFKTCST